MICCLQIYIKISIYAKNQEREMNKRTNKCQKEEKNQIEIVPVLNLHLLKANHLAMEELDDSCIRMSNCTAIKGKLLTMIPDDWM